MTDIKDGVLCFCGLDFAAYFADLFSFKFLIKVSLWSMKVYVVLLFAVSMIIIRGNVFKIPSWIF